MLSYVIDILRHQLGDHFAGYAILVTFTLLALHKGITQFQSWIKAEILEPYLAPVLEKLNHTVNIQLSHSELLVDHEDRLRRNEDRIAILQGKVQGSKREIDDERHRYR